MLKIEDLKVNYGGIEAVKGISFEVPDKSIVTLIGANGAGKSTTLRTIAGLVSAGSGSITYDGVDILSKKTHEIVSEGITLVPEGRRVFPDLTVIENIKIGAYLRNDDLSEDIKMVYDLFPRLKERSWQLAGTLSGGEQQRIALARLMIKKCSIILADEPTGSLDSENAAKVMSILSDLNKMGKTIVMVTHDTQYQKIGSREIAIDKIRSYDK